MIAFADYQTSAFWEGLISKLMISVAYDFHYL